jgi:predicted Zn-ribbon and HTH transcriptional regulator
MEPKPPAQQVETVRQQLVDELSRGPRSARDLSQALRIPEKDVEDHLGHLIRSLKTKGGRLVVTPAACASCGFTFTKRSRLSRPGRCPQCRATHLEVPLFQVTNGD